MKNKINVNFLLIQALFLCVSGIVVAKIVGISALSSVLFLATFPLTGLLWLWNIRKGLKQSDYLMLATAIFAGLFVMIDLIIHGGSFGFSYMRKVVMFVMTLMYLQAMNKLLPDWRLAEFIQVLVDALTVLMAFTFVFFHDQMYLINGILSRYLTYGFGNPNMVALYLAPMFMLTFCTLLKHTCTKKMQIFRTVVLGLQALFIMATQSRNAQMMLMLFLAVAVCVIFKDKIQEKTGIQITLRFNKWVCWLIALFPIIFAVIYMVFIGSDWVGKIFGFMVREGKELDSRVKEWAPAFRVIADSPLIGSYFDISGGTGSSQMHSTHVDTAACYGIPVMLLMSWMQKVHIYQNGKEYEDRVNFLYMMAFCCSLLMGTFEAAIYSGGLGVYVFALTFLALSKSRPGKKAEGELYGWDWVWVQVSPAWEFCKAQYVKRFGKDKEK